MCVCSHPRGHTSCLREWLIQGRLPFRLSTGAQTAAPARHLWAADYLQHDGDDDDDDEPVQLTGDISTFYSRLTSLHAAGKKQMQPLKAENLLIYQNHRLICEK